VTTPNLSNKKISKPKVKGLHPRNIHREGYDFASLAISYPLLSQYVHENIHGSLAIDFAAPLAVKALNAALLKHHYKIIDWTIPEGALCPPVPGRADYIHYIAELLDIAKPNGSLANKKSTIKMLDIGIGANGIYSLLAAAIYGWECVGSDINQQSLENVLAITTNNPQLKERLIFRRQNDKNNIFEGIIKPNEMFDVSVCNPPFHASLEEAMKSSQRKTDNLARNKGRQSHKAKSTLNFGGQEAELWCKGGEQLFLKKMIKESADFSSQCRWFTSLVSKAENVKPALKLIRKLGANDVREIEMVQGNKITRVVAWTYL